MQSFNWTSLFLTDQNFRSLISSVERAKMNGRMSLHVDSVQVGAEFQKFFRKIVEINFLTSHVKRCLIVLKKNENKS